MEMDDNPPSGTTGGHRGQELNQSIDKNAVGTSGQSLPGNQELSSNSQGNDIDFIMPSQASQQNQKAQYRSNRLIRIQQLGNKRVKSEQQNYEINLPQISLQRPVSNQSYLKSAYDAFSDQASLPSTQEFQERLQSTAQVRQTEYTQMITEYRANELDTLLTRLNEAEQLNQKIKHEAFQKRQSEFMDDINIQVKFVQDKIIELMNQSYDMSKEVYAKVNNITSSTAKLFEWYHNVSQIDMQSYKKNQLGLNARFKDQELAIASADQAIELLIEQVSNLDFTNDSQNIESKVFQVFTLLSNLIEEKLTEVYSMINSQENNAENFSKLTFTKCNEISDSCAKHIIALTNQVQQKEERILNLEKNMFSMAEHITKLDKMCQVAYFSSNILIDQDQLIKEGIQESSLKQANMLDLIAKTNHILQQHLPTQEQRNNVQKQFQDSVQSLNLKQKVELNMPQVNKISEFMENNPLNVDERSQADAFAYDENRQAYNAKIEEFFQKYPKETIYFPIKVELNQNKQNVEQSEAPKSDFINMSSTQFKNMEDEINNLKDRLSKSSMPNGQGPNILKRENGVESKPPPPPRSNQEWAKEPTFDYSKFMFDNAKPNTANVVYGGQPSKSHYHKFQVKEKFHRGMHPKIFILQFETLADQYDLSDSQKCAQLMFALQGEFLDWYKARCVKVANPPTWQQLKWDFINTYTTSNEDAEDELVRMYQYSNESADQFLQRLRKAIETSDLSDDHIKRQFITSLNSNKAKEYITFMKQFNKQMFNQHTSSTLLQELDKQSKQFNFNLNPAKNTSTPTTTKTTRYIRRYPRTYNSNYTPNKSSNSNTPISNNKSTAKTKVHVVDNAFKSDNQEQNQQQSDAIQDNNYEDIEAINNSDYIYDPASDFKNADMVEEITVVMEDDENNPPTNTSNTMFVGNTIETPPELNAYNSTSQLNTSKIQAGEATQLHNVFRKNQKQQSTISEKLSELAKQGKQLPQTNFQNIRQLQYIHLPEKQLLEEAPKQLINAFQYLQSCLISEENILNTSQTIQYTQRLMDALNLRLQEVSPMKIDQNSNIDKNDALEKDVINQEPNASNAIIINSMSNMFTTITVKQIDYLFYLNLHFENRPIKALLDTGSQATVVTEQYLKRANIRIPFCKYSKEVNVADGSKVIMRQWQNAHIKLDNYVSINTDVLISKGTTYDMLFGLSLCMAIGATIQKDYLRYYFKLNDKERFGKIPIQIQNAQ